MTSERQKLSRGNFCPATSICLFWPTGTLCHSRIFKSRARSEQSLFGTQKGGTLGFPDLPKILARAPRMASQAAWYRMENGQKSKNVKKKLAKKENGPRPEMGKKWPKNSEQMGFGVIFPLSRLFWAIFSPCRAEGHLLFFGLFLAFLDFGPFSILYQAA